MYIEIDCFKNGKKIKTRDFKNMYYAKLYMEDTKKEFDNFKINEVFED